MVTAEAEAARRYRAAGLVAVSAILVVTVISRLPHLAAGEFDWDEGVYWESLRALRAGHALASAVYSSQPPAFLLLAEPPWALLGGSIAAARGLMLAWDLVAIVAGAAIGWRLAGPLAGVVAGLLLAVDPLMVRQSLVLQADGPATSLALVSVALAVAAGTSRSPRRADLLAAAGGVALALGLLTKLLDVAVLPALAVTLLFGTGRILRGALLAAGCCLGAVAVLVPLAGRWGTIWDQSVGLHVASHQLGFGEFNSDYLAAMRLEAPLLGLAALGAILGWRRHRRLVGLGVAWIGGAVAAMAATHPLWPHHAVALIPGVALLGSVAAVVSFGWLTTQASARRWPRLASVVAATVAAGGMLWISLAALRPATMDTLIATLRQSTPAAGLLLGDEQFAAAAAGRDAPPEFVDTSVTRLASTHVSAATIEAATAGRPPVCAVLFATNRLASVPGLADWVAAHYPVRTDLENGRTLYTRPECPSP